MKCKIKLLTDTAQIPYKNYETDNCYDVCADENKIFFLWQTKAVKTGVAIQPEKGYGFVVRERSGFSLKGFAVLGGEIDNKYIGGLNVILNCGSRLFYRVKKGDRIAQIRPVKVESVEWDMVEELEETERGVNGFGSTGR